MAIDTFNKFMVAMKDDKIVMIRPPLQPITKEEALLLAAWIVALAEDNEDEFQQVLDAIRSA